MKTIISISRDADTTEPKPASYQSEASAIREINRLHEEARRLEHDSRQALDAALSAAWQAGRLLIEEKNRMRRHGGRGAWLPWLKSCFQGGTRTAQRYMQLARRIEDPAEVHGLSLRQACLRLGIPISPKRGRDAEPVPKFPPHIMLAAKLTRYLRSRPCADRAEFPPELTSLYEQLRRLMEPSLRLAA